MILQNSFNLFLNFAAFGCLGFVIILILCHLLSKYILYPKKSLDLSKDSLVVITGGCLGIGRQMALEIAKLYKCKILVVDYRQDLFQKIKFQLQQLGSSTQSYHCDLGDQKSVEKFINFINYRNDKIALFIHNAGIHIPKRVLQTTTQQFMLQYRVNFLTPVKIMRQTIRLMQNGHLAVVASMAALAHGGIDVSTYSSSKYALYSFVNSFRQQLKADKHSVSISLGCPYMITTGMFQGYRTKLDFLFRTLTPQYVAKRLIKQFIKKKQICYLYQYEALLFKIVALFPSEMLDYLSINFNVSNFEKIKNKHDSKRQKEE